jgi:RNA polymerase sigma-70 factor (ECF subfamily)
MQDALATLTETQRRRFLLYHEHGLCCEQIAAVDGCTHPAVLKAISAAQEKLEKYFSGEGYKTGG